LPVIVLFFQSNVSLIQNAFYDNHFRFQSLKFKNIQHNMLLR